MNLIVTSVDPDRSTHARRSTFWTVPISLALIGGMLEVGVLYVQQQRQPLRHLSPDFVWMAPLALLAVTALVLIPFRLLPAALRWRAATTAIVLSSSLVFLNLLMLVPRMAHYAAAVLALGAALQLTRAIARQPPRAVALLRAAIVLLILGVAVIGVAASRWRSSQPAVPATPALAGRPNVIFITLDTVRAANLSLYGYSRETTPMLRKYAARGVTFEAAYSPAPWTLPSHASLFTGRWPHELTTDYESPLDGTHPTLAEYFSTRGYRTAGFVANMRYCGAATGLSRGFAKYEDYPRSLGEVATSSTLVRTVANNFRLRRLIENDQHLDRVSSPDLTDRAAAWIDQNATPFFLFLNYFDAHEPYLPPPPYDRQFGNGREHGRHSPLHHWLWDPAVGHRDLAESERQEEIDAYDGSLAYLDSHVGRLLAHLEERGQLERTLVVITADHGEEFGEHGLYDHGYSLYQTALHVPLLILGYGTTDVRDRRVRTPVSLRDLAATITTLLTPSETSPFPGVALGGLWRDPTATITVSPVVSQVTRAAGQPDWFPTSKGDMQSIVREGLHYIRNSDGRQELYELETDPLEQHDLSGLPEHAAALARARDALERALMPARVATSVQPGPQ